MKRSPHSGLSAAVLTLGLLATLSASGQGASSLPGGATSLRETYDDWVVACAVPQSGKTCAMQQELKAQQTGQRVLAIELQPKGAGAAGTLVLPFGLALANGASLQIDDGAAGTPLRFSTCLPAGCIVSLDLDAKMLAGLRKGTALNVKVTPADGGAETQLAISLKGFASAFDRTAALLK
jgi:invasion protein IalB